MSAATATRPKVKHTTAIELARAEKTANDDLKTVVAEIRVEISKLTADNIKKRKEIGDRIRSITLDASGKYGTNPRQEIEALMPLSRDGIRPMVKFAEVYDDDDVEKLLSFKHPTTNEGISWSHIVSLTRVRDKADAIELAERAVTKGWSAKELTAEVIRSSGGPRSKGGRKPRRSDTFEACVGDVVAKSVAFQNSTEQWLSSGGLSDLCQAERPSATIAEQLRKTLETVDNMMMKVHTLSAAIRAIHVQVVAALTPRQIV